MSLHALHYIRLSTLSCAKSTTVSGNFELCKLTHVGFTHALQDSRRPFPYNDLPCIICVEIYMSMLEAIPERNTHKWNLYLKGCTPNDC